MKSPTLQALSPGCRYNTIQRCCRCCCRTALLPSALRVFEDRELFPSPWWDSSFLLKMKGKLLRASSPGCRYNTSRYCLRHCHIAVRCPLILRAFAAPELFPSPRLHSPFSWTDLYCHRSRERVGQAGNAGWTNEFEVRGATCTASCLGIVYIAERKSECLSVTDITIWSEVKIRVVRVFRIRFLSFDSSRNC